MTTDPWGDRRLRRLASTGMGKKIAIVALFAFLGLGVGVGIAAARPNPRAYQFTYQFSLPVHSRATIVHFAALARSQHLPRVRVLVLTKRVFQIVAYGGTASGAEQTGNTAVTALPRVPHPRYAVVFSLSKPGPVYSFWPAVLGLALGLAIGILVAIVRSRRASVDRGQRRFAT